MNDKFKKRNWIKNVAIIFLVIMLILTFFSNTIMNYSLPQVATVYVQPGSITAKVRGTGMVEASDPYNVVATEGRKIESVAVSVGQVVQKGDVLFYLEDSESEELKMAQDTLEDLENAYMLAILTGNISSDVFDRVESGEDTSLSDYQADVQNARDKVDSAQSSVDSHQDKVNDLSNQISVLEVTYVDVSAEQAALKTAQTNLENAQAELAYRQDVYESCAAVANGYGISVEEANDAIADKLAIYNDAKANYDVVNNDPASTDAAKETAKDEMDAAYEAYIAATYTKTNLELAMNSLYNAQANLTTAQGLVKNCQTAVDNATKALNDKLGTDNRDTTISNLRHQLVEAQNDLADAQDELAKAQQGLSDLLSDIQSEINLSSQYEELQEQRALVEELKAKTTDGTVVAPVSGTVLSLYYSAGDTYYSGDTVAVLQDSAKGFTVTFPVTIEQSKKISVGDIAEISNAWYYGDIMASVTAIKPDPSNPQQNRLVQCSLTGDVVAGVNMSLSVGGKSANYDLTVPNSAIREDSNGKFILIVESKSSPLGNRYIATRVDVQVIASDDTQSAISAALYGYEYVITTASKPVEAGKQVRLTE